MRPKAELAKIRRYSAGLTRTILLFYYSTDFAVRKTVVVQHFARFQANLGNLYVYHRIYLLCTYTEVLNNNDFLTIYGLHANLLNNNTQ